MVWNSICDLIWVLFAFHYLLFTLYLMLIWYVAFVICVFCSVFQDVFCMNVSTPKPQSCTKPDHMNSLYESSQSVTFFSSHITAQRGISGYFLFHKDQASPAVWQNRSAYLVFRKKSQKEWVLQQFGIQLGKNTHSTCKYAYTRLIGIVRKIPPSRVGRSLPASTDMTFSLTARVYSPSRAHCHTWSPSPCANSLSCEGSHTWSPSRARAERSRNLRQSSARQRNFAVDWDADGRHDARM